MANQNSTTESTFQKVFNKDNATLIKAALPYWQDRIPNLSKNRWKEIGTAITSDKYTPLRNEVFENLINRIGETIIQTQSFFNPLSVLKEGGMVYGDTVQEIATDVIAQEEYMGGAECDIGKEPNQFARAPSDVVAAYHRINRQAQYTMTIDDPRMRRAFIEPRGLFTLLDEKIAMLEKSNIIDEFIYTKKLITSFFNEGNLQSKQQIKAGDITPQSDAAAVKQWLIQVKTALRGLTFPTRGTTKMNIMTQTAPTDLVCILRYDIPIINEVSNIAQAFHAEAMDLTIPIISVDSFSDTEADDSSIVGVICDKRAFRIKEIYRSMTTADNARALYRNYFFNIWQTYLASPLKPVVYITK